MARLNDEKRNEVPARNAGIMEDKNQMQRRVKMMAHARQTPHWPLLAMVLTSAFVVGFTDAESKRSPETLGSGVGVITSNGRPVAAAQVVPGPSESPGQLRAPATPPDGRLWSTVLFGEKPVPKAEVRFRFRERQGVVKTSASGFTDERGRTFIYVNPEAERLLVGHEACLDGARTARGKAERWRAEKSEEIGLHLSARDFSALNSGR